MIGMLYKDISGTFAVRRKNLWHEFGKPRMGAENETDCGGLQLSRRSGGLRHIPICAWCMDLDTRLRRRAGFPGG